jgi:putative endonuclease
MIYVYILQSEKEAERFYTGVTNDIARRLEQHNSGQSSHTKKYMPWRVKTYVAFDDALQSENFEVYLKTASGRAFAKKRL